MRKVHDVMTKHNLRIIYVLMFFAIFIGAGCDGDGQQASQSGAKQADLVTIPLNSNGLTTEQQNILDRIRVTTDPTNILWIHVISPEGKFLRKMSVKGKVTSSGKRLQPVHATNNSEVRPDSPFLKPDSVYYWETDEFIQPDGTYGSSGEYDFWFDVTARYHQLMNVGYCEYLLTDYPINCEDPINKTTGLYNVDNSSADWQEGQESLLREKEGESYKKWKKQFGELESDLRKLND